VPPRLLHQFGRFVVVGLLATGLQYAILVFCVQALGLRPALGSGLGFALSAGVNYILNHRFTFRSGRAHLSAIWRFIAVAGIGLLLNIGLMEVLVERWRVQYMLAQLVVTAITLLWNFAGSAFFSFVNPDSDRTVAVREGGAGET
jgi:putative flippase GtrA